MEFIFNFCWLWALIAVLCVLYVMYRYSNTRMIDGTGFLNLNYNNTFRRCWDVLLAVIIGYIAIWLLVIAIALAMVGYIIRSV